MAGRGWEHPGMVKGVPARGTGMGMRRSVMSLPTQTILCFYGLRTYLEAILVFKSFYKVVVINTWYFFVLLTQ